MLKPLPSSTTTTTPALPEIDPSALKAARIDTRPVFTPISQYPFWPRPAGPQPVAEAIGLEGINLPSGVRLRRDQVTRVGAAIRAEVEQASRRRAA